MSQHTRPSTVVLAILICALSPPCLISQSSGGKEDNPDARPPVTRNDVLIVKRAREILNSESKWNRADNRVCPSEAKTFSLYCDLEHATNEVSGKFEHRGAVMQEARFVIDEIAPRSKEYHHRLMDYNNDPATTFADVQRFFRILEERVAARLTQQSGAANQ
jgi:hypothetical protein